MIPRKALAAAVVVAVAAPASAAELVVTVRDLRAGAEGAILGTVALQDTAKGLRIVPNLRGLSEGQHGFHVHQNADCGPAEKDGEAVPGLAAGGHYDPQNTDRHAGPRGNGHLGDLPVLYVDGKGEARRTAFAPRLKTPDLKDRSIVIHAGGDNYADTPAPLGGGGARIACGVVVY